MKNKFIISLFSLLIVAEITARAQTAGDYIAQGRASLVNHDLWNAHASFTAALALSPTNETANALVAATRLLVLPQTAAGSNFLNQLGVTNAGRDVYNWTAMLPEDTNGNPVWPANYNSSAMVTFYRTNVMVALAASATNLANIKSPGFTLSLSASETSSQDVTVDYGDIQLLRALVAAAQFFGYTANAQNSSVVIPTIQQMGQNHTLTFQSLLATYPSLLTLNNSADLAASKSALTNGLMYYFAASDFIRNVRALDAVRLFNLDTNDWPDEANFRRDATNALASLNGPVILDPHLTFSVNASNYFSGAKTVRSLLPSFNGNSYVNNSLPDYTFGGMLVNEPAYLTEINLRNMFPSYAGIYLGHVNDMTYGDSDAGLFLTFLGTDLQASVAGYDYDSAQNINGAQSGGVGAQFPADSHGNWEFNSNAVAGVSGWGNFYKDGTMDGELDFTNSDSVWLHGSSMAALQKGNSDCYSCHVQEDFNASTFQGAAGLYSGTWASGSKSGTLRAVLAANGSLAFCVYNGGVQNDGGYGKLDQVNHFISGTAEGSTVAGTLAGTTLSGTFTNGGATMTGTWSMTRSKTVPFDYPPVVTRSLTNVIVAVGSNVTMSLVATGSAPICYQWYCNYVPIAGAITNSLTISNASLALNGNVYGVSINNAAGGTNLTAFLTVGDATKPVVTNLNLTTGQRVSNGVFTVTGTASDNSGVASVWYQLNNGAWMLASSTNNWTNWWATLPLQVGTNTLRTYAVDINNRGILYVADGANNLIRKIAPGGVVTTFAGDVYDLTNGTYNGGYADGAGTAAKFSLSWDGCFSFLATDSAGNVYVADTYNNLIRKITSAGVVTTLAGDVYDLTNGTNNSGYADGVGTAAKFNLPTGIAVDSAGNVLVADNGNNLIRKIAPDRTVTTVAGDTNFLGSGFADGVGSAALFSNLNGLAMDSAGNLMVADSGNNLIRKIAPDGTVGTLAGDTYDLTNKLANNGYAEGVGTAAKFNNPVGLAIDGAGNILVADRENNLIRKITPGGTVTTLAGDIYDLTNNSYNSGFADGVGTAAKFYYPLGEATDIFGNVIVADSVNNLVRRITSAGAVTTLAGDVYDLTNYYANSGYANGAGGAAMFNVPCGAALDSSGGNISPTNTVAFVYVVSGLLQLQTVGQGTITPNYSNTWLQIGQNYSMTAAPTNGFAFSSWTISTNWIGGTVTNNATVQFMMVSNLTLQAAFVDTNKPSISLLTPTNNQRWSNAAFTVTGTTRDNVQVSNVWFKLNTNDWQLAALAGNGTNWSADVNLTAGTNTLLAYAVDLAGNISTNASASIVYIVSAQLLVQNIGLGTISPNYSNAWLQAGQNYSITATPATGFKFVSWTISTNWGDGRVTNNPTVQFMMVSNLTLSVNYSDTNAPTLSITNLASGQRVSNALFTVKGTAADNWHVANVYYQINNTGWSNAVGTTSWNGQLSLAPGTNQVTAYATDNTGNHSLTNSLNFQYVVTNQLAVRAAGLGTITPNYSNSWLEVGRNYSMTATPGIGFVATNWIIATNWIGGRITNNAAVQFMMVSNLTLQVTFADVTKPTLTVTAPTAGQKMTNALATLVGTASDNWKVAGVWYQLNGADWSLAGTTNGFTNWSKTVALLAGTNTLKAYALDLGGNVSTTNAVSVVSSNSFKLQLAFSNAPASGSGLSFNLQISPGLNGRIQVSTNLTSWVALTNFVGTNSSLIIRDPNATNSSRFYRAVVP